jgi:hypothetical protein
MKKIILVAGALGLTGVLVAAHAMSSAGERKDPEKITNSSSDLKAALKKSGYDGKPGDLSDLAGGTKIASLDASAMKDKIGDKKPVLMGDLVQGGLVLGTTQPGAKVMLDDISVPVSAEGRFLLGFGRDHPATAKLVITFADGSTRASDLEIADRDFPEQSITIPDQSKVSGFTEEQLKKIRISTDKKKKARETQNPHTDWAGGFEWPVKGPISGVFGSRRILNGEPKRPHSGTDVAAPTGTPIKAPASGLVTLADQDMYFEGGLVLINHGQGLESALMHMSSIDVKAGQRVERGEVIGKVGATGRVTGPHLHWSLKWQNRLVDAQLVVPEMGADE